MEDSMNIRNAALASALVGLLLYANTLDCGFCFDDQAVIMNNPDVRPNVSWINIWLDDFWGTPMSSNKTHGSYRPLCVATFRLNYLLHELQPMGYHLVNVLLHSAVCFLYVQLCGVVFGEARPALIAGLLFAVHPIHTEAVAGLVGRADTMAGIFFLLSLISYRRAAEGQGFQWVWWTLLCCLCSVLSKEMGITVIPICLTYDLFVANESGLSSILKFLFDSRPQSKKTAPTWIKPFLKRAAALVVFVVIFMVLRIRLMKVTPTFAVEDNEALALDAPYRQLHWAYMTFINSWLLLNPSWICHDWRMGAIPLITSFADPRNLLTVITLGTVGLLGLYSIIRINGGSGGDRIRIRNEASSSGRNNRNKKILTFGLSLIIFPFIPASNLFILVGFVVAERILYLPSMGFCLLIAYGVWCMLKPRRSNQFLTFLGKAGLVLLLVTHAAKTVQRNRDWYSKLTLYTSAFKKYPTNGHLLGNMGRQYTLLGDSDFAEELYKYAIEVAPDVWLPFMNYGVLLKKQRRLDEAEAVLKRAVVLMIDEKRISREKVTRVYVTLGNIIGQNSGRLDEALEFNRRGIEVYPTIAEAHNSRGSILHQMNRLPEARASFEEAIKLNPQYANAHFNRGLVLLHMGDRKNAEQDFKKALSIDKNHFQAKAQLSLLREQQ